MASEEVLATLAEMGCYRIWIGSESGSQRILDAMQRGATVEQVRWSVKAAQRHGIQVGLFLMWGYEGEELEDIAATSGDKWSDVMLGASFDFDVNTNNMLVFATELEFYNWEPSKKAEGDEQEFFASVLPSFYIALDPFTAAWFTARGGVNMFFCSYRLRARLGR